LFWLDRFGVWNTKVLWSYGQTVIYSSLFRLWKVLKYGEKTPILICLICFHISTTVLEKLIEKNYFLHKSAQEAYKSYIRAYASHSLKNIYEVNNLDLKKVALSFGFKVPPYVDLSILYKSTYFFRNPTTFTITNF
jgi:hypothetical protein